jgi:hypothetical protein
MHKDENPIAAGNYDDTFRDDPDQEMRCPHCKTLWEMRQVESTIDNRLHERPLYDWQTQDGKYAYSTHDTNVTPVRKDCCYACAYETATDDDLLSFAREHVEDFRDWRIGLETN